MTNTYTSIFCKIHNNRSAESQYSSGSDRRGENVKLFGNNIGTYTPFALHHILTMLVLMLLS